MPIVHYPQRIDGVINKKALDQRSDEIVWNTPARLWICKRDKFHVK